jgi:hypothetical protein
LYSALVSETVTVRQQAKAMEMALEVLVKA